MPCLLMLGDVKAEEGIALAKNILAIFPPEPRHPSPIPREPEQTEERRGNVEEKFGTLPAMAIGYVMPERRTPIGARWRCSIRPCTADARDECIANWCWKNKSPSKPTAALTIIFGYNGPTQMTTRLLHKPEYLQRGNARRI